MGTDVEIRSCQQTGLTARLVEFIVGTRYENIPAEVIRLAKYSFLDTLGLALGGMTEPAPQILTRYVKTQGGIPTATILTQGFKTCAPFAALVNGTAGDVAGWSDVSVIQMNHPSVSICPAAWAVGEQLGSSGKDILLAHIAGTEVANKIGAGIRPGFQLKGWHPVAVLNTFGAAAAVGKLLKLDFTQMANALGIAGAEASGIRAAMGTMSKAYGAGRSARDGITCALLASMGFTGPTDVLEARDGFLQTFGDGCSGANILEHLGDPFEFVSPGISLKKFPSCTRSHNAIQGVLDLIKKNGFKSDDVELVECLVTPAVADFLKFSSPRTKFEAKYSMEFCVAAALLDGNVTISSFSDTKVRDSTIVSLMQRVKMTVWAEYAKDGYNPPYAPYGCVVKIKLRNGKELSERIDQGPWVSQNAPSWDEVVEKYRSNAELVLKKDAVDQSIAMVKNIERLENITHLVDKLRLA